MRSVFHKRASSLAGVFLFGAVSASHAGPLFNLGAAKNFTVLQVGSGSVIEQADLSNPQGKIYGNVGVASGGKVERSGPQIAGDLYLGNNTAASFSGSYASNRPVMGMTHLGSGATLGPGGYTFTTMSDNPNALLNQARTDAINASNSAKLLRATSAVTKIDSSMTVFGSGVYILSSLSLGNNEVLTLSGNIGDSIVFNIADIFKLNGAKIVLTGGLTESNILFNYTGASAVAFSAGATQSELHGIILALNAKVALSPGLVVGEIISAYDISIVSGAVVQNAPLGASAVPDGGSTLVLLALSLLVLIAPRSSRVRATLLAA